MSEVRTASTLADALERLVADPASRPLAGGLGVLLGRALASDGLGSALPPSGRWLDVRMLPELAGIRRMPDGRCLLGAVVTITELAASADVPAVLRAAAAAVGNPGVRAAGTVGGNLVGSGASSDLMAAMVALGAVGLVEGSGGKRRVPVAQIPRLLGVDRAPAGGPHAALLLRGIELAGAAPSGWGFERLTFQGAMDRSAATVAVVVTAPGDARSDTRPVRVRIVATSVADEAIRFRRTERRITVEPRIGPGELEAVASADVANVALRSDLRVSDWYRRAVIPVLVRRAVEAALHRLAMGGPP